MPYFSRDFLEFFQELEKNNSKDWFDTNRKRYERFVKVPFKKFAQELASAMQELYPNYDLSDKWNVTRINRDIRFSADKTPYKTFMGTMILPHGKQNKTKPGLYLEANHEYIKVYSGVHMPEKQQLYSLREHIAKNHIPFENLVNNQSFIDTFGEIRGEKNKRLPSEFQKEAEKQPLLFNKSFYYFFKKEPELLLQEDIIDELLKEYKIAMPLNKFLLEGMGN